MTSFADIYGTVTRYFLKKTFFLWQALGFHIIPNHYYEPIPDTRELKPSTWTKVSDLPGINIKENDQLSLLTNFSGKYKNEYNGLPHNKTSVPYEYYLNNASFGPVDAEILYCMVRHFKPKMIYEIGSGFSTFISAKAMLLNEQETKTIGKLTAFEPYPNKTIKNGFPGLSNLIQERIQDIDVNKFLELNDGDFLFIDSSHVLKMGSDVQHEYLEILPRLNKGVIIHCHDIFFPMEYPKSFINERKWFWNEQYLLQAFLAFNDSFEILWAGSYMNVRHPDKLKAAFNSYNTTDCPGSLWIRRTR